MGKPKTGLSINGLTNITDVQAEIFWQLRGNGLSLDGLTSITDTQAASLGKTHLVLSLNGLTNITDAQAEIFGQLRGENLSLDGLTSITDIQMASLAKFKGDRLNLNGLRSITNAQATSLAKFGGGELSLNGLTSLTEAKVESLAIGVQELSLNGLTSLTEAQVESLAKSGGYRLFLNGLTSITDTQAKNFEHFIGVTLSLNGITILTDAQAESLAKFGSGYNYSLYLNGLTKLTDAQAESFAKFGDETSDFLYLNGITTLTDAQAESLAKFGDGYDDLHLNGLTTLTDAQTKSLANFGGQVYAYSQIEEKIKAFRLKKVEVLEKQAMSLLQAGKFEPALKTFDSIRVIDSENQFANQGEETIRRLNEEIFWYPETLALAFLSDQAAKHFANLKEKRLYLDGITFITDAQADILRHFKGDWLTLNGLKSLTDEQADSLKKFEGEWLSLDALTFLTEAQARSLGEFGGYISAPAHLREKIAQFRRIETVATEKESEYALYQTAKKAVALFQMGQELEAIKTFDRLNPEAARQGKQNIRLLNPPGGLALFIKSEAARLPPPSWSDDRLEKTIRALTQKVTFLTDEAAAILIKDGGYWLEFDALAFITDTQVEMMVNSKVFSIYLNALTSLTEAQAKTLGKFEGSLSIDGLTSLTDVMAENFAKFKGKALHLDGLTSLTAAQINGLAKFDGEQLFLNGLTSFADAETEKFKFKVKNLYLNGLTSISDAQAEILAKFKGMGLEFNALTVLTDAQAESLGHFGGNWLEFNSIGALTDAQAKSLAKFGGIVIALNNIGFLSDVQRKILGHFDGKIEVPHSIQIEKLMSSTQDGDGNGNDLPAVVFDENENSFVEAFLKSQYAKLIKQGRPLVIEATSSSMGGSSADENCDEAAEHLIRRAQLLSNILHDDHSLIEGLEEHTLAEAVKDKCLKNKEEKEVKQWISSLASLAFKPVIVSESKMGRIFNKEKNGDRDGWELFYSIYPKAPGIIEISRPGFSSDGRIAVIYLGHQSHWLSGSGDTYVYIKLDGKWEGLLVISGWIS